MASISPKKRNRRVKTWVRSTKSLTTAAMSISASGEVTGAFWMVLMVGRKADSSWCWLAISIEEKNGKKTLSTWRSRTLSLVSGWKRKMTSLESIIVDSILYQLKMYLLIEQIHKRWIDQTVNRTSVDAKKYYLEDTSNLANPSIAIVCTSASSLSSRSVNVEARDMPVSLSSKLYHKPK